MATATASHFDTAEGVALLQRRVGLVGKVLTLVFTLGQGFNTIMAVAQGRAHLLLEPAILLGWLGVGMAAGMWMLCRGPARSRRFIETVETAAILGAVVVVTLMGRYVNLQVLDEITGGTTDRLVGQRMFPFVASLTQLYTALSLMLGLVFPFALRAALVPSSVQRTALLTAAAIVPLVVVSALGYVPFEADRIIRDATPPGRKSMFIAAIIVWWTLATIVCTAITKTVYNLRRQVQRAMQLGQYTLELKLGEGGMGVVYRARHALMRRPTAIKLLRPEKGGEASLARFEREVQLTAQLTHPNTITIYDYGRTPDGILYYAMELLSGATVEDLVQVDGAQPAARVVRLLTQVCGALAEAHDIGLIHRDIKPANIVLCEQGGEHDVAKVLDFGLVKTVREPDQAGLTRDGTVTGTPQYMPPEALSDPDQVDARSDLYALGAVGYYMLTGTHVFEGDTLVEICGHHLHTPPTPPAERLGEPMSAALEAAILDCLAKKQQDRPQTARELRKRLLACRDVGTWDAEQAEAWWAERGDAMRPSRRVPQTAGTRTLAVDLARGRDRA